jgi:hypothetical protein
MALARLNIGRVYILEDPMSLLRFYLRLLNITAL